MTSLRRLIAIIHVLAFAVAATWDFVFRSEVIDRAVSVVLHGSPSPPGGMTLLGVLAITSVGLTVANAVLFWRNSDFLKVTILGWWFLTGVNAVVLGPIVRSSISQFSSLLLAGTAGIILWVAYRDSFGDQQE